MYNFNNVPNFVESNVLPTTYVIKNGQIHLVKKGATNWNNRTFKKELDELLENSTD